MTRVSTEPARRLRRNQTDAERLLWFRLRDRRLAGWKFKRQVPIDRFVVDFLCADAKLIVEPDGGQHDHNKARDADRTRVLQSMGLPRPSVLESRRYAQYGRRAGRDFEHGQSI
jgi:very-short-patch-repair endonuclease